MDAAVQGKHRQPAAAYHNRTSHAWIDAGHADDGGGLEEVGLGRTAVEIYRSTFDGCPDVDRPCRRRCCYRCRYDRICSGRPILRPYSRATLPTVRDRALPTPLKGLLCPQRECSARRWPLSFGRPYVPALLPPHFWPFIPGVENVFSRQVSSESTVVDGCKELIKCAACCRYGRCRSCYRLCWCSSSSYDCSCSSRCCNRHTHRDWYAGLFHILNSRGSHQLSAVAGARTKLPDFSGCALRLLDSSNLSCKTAQSYSSISASSSDSDTIYSNSRSASRADLNKHGEDQLFADAHTVVSSCCHFCQATRHDRVTCDIAGSGDPGGLDGYCSIRDDCDASYCTVASSNAVFHTVHLPTSSMPGAAPAVSPGLSAPELVTCRREPFTLEIASDCGEPPRRAVMFRPSQLPSMSCRRTAQKQLLAQLPHSDSVRAPYARRVRSESSGRASRPPVASTPSAAASQSTANTCATVPAAAASCWSALLVLLASVIVAFSPFAHSSWRGGPLVSVAMFSSTVHAERVRPHDCTWEPASVAAVSGSDALAAFAGLANDFEIDGNSELDASRADEQSHSRAADSSVFQHTAGDAVATISTDTGRGGTLSAVCRVYALKGGTNPTNFSLALPGHTRRLAVHCGLALGITAAADANDSKHLISVLSNRTFERLRALHSLTIERCLLSWLPARAFAGLDSLRHLAIRNFADSQATSSSASLSSSSSAPSLSSPVTGGQAGAPLNVVLRLNPEAFAGSLIALESLDLSENGIDLLPTGVLCSLPRLRFVNLTHNRFADVTNLGLGESTAAGALAMTPADGLRGFGPWKPHGEIGDDYRSTSGVDGNERIYRRQRHRAALTTADGSGHENDHGDRFGAIDSSGVPHHLSPTSYWQSQRVRDRGGCIRQLNVRTVELAHNQLKALPDRSFSLLGGHLKELRLDHNQIARADADALAGLGVLERLDLAHNALVALPAGLFEATPRLVELYLRNNSLSALPPRLFTGLGRLTMLDLAHNALSTGWLSAGSPASGGAAYVAAPLPSRSGDSLSPLSDLVQLTALDLSHNRLTRLEPTAFQNLARLQTLQLQHNVIEFIADHTFASLISLQSLLLGGNRLKSIEPATLSGLGSLMMLQLDNNRLDAVRLQTSDAAAAAVLPMLQELNLAANRLTAVPRALGTLGSLRSLDLSDNTIQNVANASFHGLSQLYALNLMGNRIGNLSQGAFTNLPSVRVLNLARNSIGAIEQGTFDDVPGLHYLRLDSNRIDDVNELFSQLHDLIMLNVSVNRVRWFDYALIPVGLQWLDIHSNEVEALGNYFELEHSLKLRTLDASHNRLTDLDASSLPNGIEIVYLAHNQLKRIQPFTFLGKQNLTRVDLTHNALETLELTAFRLSEVPARRPLPEFAIAVNPYLCDCHMEWLQRLQITTLATAQDGASSRSPVDTRLTAPRPGTGSIGSLRAGSYGDDNNDGSVGVNAAANVDDGDFLLMRAPNSDDGERRAGHSQGVNGPAGRTSSVASSASYGSIRQYPRIVDLHSVECRLSFLRTAADSSSPHYQTQRPRQQQQQQTASRASPGAAVPLVTTTPSQFVCEYRSHCFSLCHCCDFDACDCEMVCPENCTCYHDQSWTSNVVDCGGGGAGASAATGRRANHVETPRQLPMDVSDLYIDGNDIRVLTPHAFIGRKAMRRLFANGSSVATIENRTFAGLYDLRVLRLDANELTVLVGHEFDGLSRLRELYLSNNRLRHIDNATFDQLHSLERLHLDGNRLHEVAVWRLARSTLRLTDLRLERNPWSCRCDFVRTLVDFLHSTRGSDVIGGQIFDLSCAFNVTTTLLLWELNVTAACDRDLGGALITLTGAGFDDAMNTGNLVRRLGRPFAGAGSEQVLTPLFAVVASVVLMVIAAIGATITCRRRLGVWLFSRYGVRVFRRRGGGGGVGGSGGVEEEKLFDAFVSYSRKDEAFVAQILAPELECGSPPYRLCLHYRDLPMAGGSYLSEAIVEAVESSRRTIVVLSEHFLKSEWCRYEFKSAHHEVLHNTNHRLVVIFVGRVSYRELDPDIRAWLKHSTFLHWGEKNFWDKLRYAMPDARPRNKVSTLRSTDVTSVAVHI